MILMKLRRRGDAGPPAELAVGGAVEAVEQQQSRIGLAQAGEQGGERRLAAARGALEQQALAGDDTQIAYAQDRTLAAGVAIAELAGFDDGLGVGVGAALGIGGLGSKEARAQALAAGGGGREASDLAPRDH